MASCGGGSQPLASGGPGPRPPGTTTWLREARCTDPGNAGDGSAAPGEKSPRWSAERRASRVTGRKAPRKRLAYRVISAFTRVCDAHDTPHGCLARTRTFLGAPPTPRFGVSEATMQNPDANASRERDGLFDMVNFESAAPAFVIAGLDTPRGLTPLTWSSPAVTGAGSRSCANKAAMTAKTPNARTKRKARLRPFPVFVLFRPVISGKPGRPGRRRGAPVSCFHPGACGETRTTGLCPAVLFSPVIYRDRRRRQLAAPLFRNASSADTAVLSVAKSCAICS